MQKKNKILHLLQSNHYSGAENVAIQIIELLESTNNELIYSSSEGEIQEVLKRKNILFEPLNKINISEVKRVVDKYDPDIVHAHDFTMSVLASFACPKKKIISHLHNNPSWIKSPCLKSLVYLFASLHVYKILYVSDSIVNEYIFSKFIKKKATNIGNPLNIKLIQEKCNINFDKSIDLLFIGRLVEQKDPLKFIEIVHKLAEKNKNINCVVLGKGKLKEKMLQSIEINKLKENIKLLGFVDNPYEYIKKSKVVCMPSKWEGFGLVAVESLALGTPVVCSKVGGLVDIVDETCGKLCEEKEDYNIEIELLLNNDNYYAKKSLCAKQKALSMHNIQKYIQKLVEIYEIKL